MTKTRLLPGKQFHRYYRLPGNRILLSRMALTGNGYKETAWNRKVAFCEDQLDLGDCPEREMSQEDARKIFGDQWFPPMCSESPGHDEERLRRLAEMGDREAQKCLRKLKYRTR